MMLIALHGVDESKLVDVIAEMRTMGAPTIRCVEDGNGAWAIEGTHRLAAAAALGMTPVLEIVDGDDDTEIRGLDLDDQETMTLAALREYVIDTRRVNDGSCDTYKI
jgi:hypothetical protein